MPTQSQTATKTNLEIDRGAHTIRLKRIFDAPRAQIFEAWTRPEHVTCWWDAAGVPLTVCEIDLRPGESFKFVTKGHPEMPFVGTYREIAPPERLVFEAIGATGRVSRRCEQRKSRFSTVSIIGTPTKASFFILARCATRCSGEVGGWRPVYGDLN